MSKNPTFGVSLGNNCFKIRVSIKSKGKGKSGGARIITYVFIQTKSVYLLSIYDKGEKETLKPNELKEIINNLEFDS